jgi:hypothetical protein
VNPLNHRTPKAAIAATLIASLAVQAVAPLALAGEPGPSGGASLPTYVFRSGLPDQGMLDAYHSATDARDRVSHSLYALRSTAIEDLLNTRRALKVLIGGSERLRSLPDGKDLYFEVPGTVTDLYLTNAGRSDSDSGAGSDLGRMASAIRWLNREEPRYDTQQRTRLLMGLAFVSAQIAKLDQLRKFVETDYWNHPMVSLQYSREEIQPALRNQALGSAFMGGSGATGLSEDHRTALKQRWYEKHAMTGLLQEIATQREFLLDRYHLLGAPIDGKPLYQRIYAAMAAMEKQGFPSPLLVQPVIDPKLPEAGKPIPLPDSFEKAVHASLDRLLAPEARREFLTQLSHAVNAQVDQAFVLALRANTSRLEELTSAVHYDGSRSSPLLELARHEDLWDATLAKYRHLEGLIDFRGARQEMKRYFAKKDKASQRVRWIAFGAGIGVGIAAMAISFGTAGQAATLLGLPARYWLVGSGLLTTGQSWADYAASSTRSRLAQETFFGTSRIGSYREMQDAIALEESDYKVLWVSAALLGFEARAWRILPLIGKPLQAGRARVVKLTRQELGILRQAISDAAKRSGLMGPLGKMLVSAVRNIAQAGAGGSDVFMNAEQAIPLLARELGMTPARVIARLESSRAVGWLIRGMRLRNEASKIVAKKSFFRELVEQEAVALSLTLVAERAERGDQMLKKELPDFITDMVQEVLITFTVTYFGAPTSALKKDLAGDSLQEASALVKADRNFFRDNYLGQVMKKSGQNMAMGIVINSGAWSASQFIQYMRERDDPKAIPASERAEIAAKNALYGTVFMGTSSTARYEVYQWIGNVARRAIKDDSTVKLIIQSTSAANHTFGGWHYVRVAKGLGIMKDGDDTPIPLGAAEQAPELDADFTRLAVEDQGGAYMRIEGDSTPAGFMFDFMQDEGSEAQEPATAAAW